MARLPQLIGRNRALEVLLSSEDLNAELAEAYGYVNWSLPDSELDAHVEALATRVARFDKWAIVNTKRLVNTSLPPGVELGAEWGAWYRFGRATRRPQRDQGVDGARLPPAGRCRESPGILFGPNPALGPITNFSSAELELVRTGSAIRCEPAEHISTKRQETAPKRSAAQTSSIRRSRPIVRAAQVCRVTEACPGTKNRSKAARLVFIRFGCK